MLVNHFIDKASMDPQIAEYRRQKHAENERRKRQARIREKYAELLCLDPIERSATRIVRWIKRRPSRTQFYVNMLQEDAEMIPGKCLYRTMRDGDLYGFDLRTIKDYAYLFEDDEWNDIQRQCRLIDTSTKLGNDFRIMLDMSRSLARDWAKMNLNS